jgi:hypothetical protein
MLITIEVTVMWGRQYQRRPYAQDAARMVIQEVHAVINGS